MKLTILIEKSEDGWLIGQLAEHPGAIAQAQSLEELKVSLAEAFALLLESERDLTLARYRSEGVSFFTEPLMFNADEATRFAPAS